MTSAAKPAPTALPAEAAKPTAKSAAPAVVPSADEELANAFAAMLTERHSALPYLFLGSGISRRYLGLPDWEGLLRVFADEIGENFNYHLASANGDYPAAATTVAAAFHAHWWKEERYADQVRAHEETAKVHQHGAIKVAIAQYILDRQELVAGRPGLDDPALAAEIELLRKVVVDGVITTNYDSLTDQLFPTFSPYVGQEELMFSDAQFIAETYKIHGSAERPQSLILTAEDYQAFSDRNHYLAAKLLTIFAEHPVLFMGYSLNDLHLGEILGNIATAVGPDRLRMLDAWRADLFR